MDNPKPVLLFSLFMAIAAPFVIKATFAHLVVIVLLQIFIVLPLTAIALIKYFINKRQGHPRPASPGKLATIALIIFLQTLSIPIIAKLENSRVTAAENYLESFYLAD